MKIRANDIDLRDAERFDSCLASFSERFDSFFSVIFNCKIKYCCSNKKLNNFLSKQKITPEKLLKRSASLKT